jgi:hypothetical protein
MVARTASVSWRLRNFFNIPSRSGAFLMPEARPVGNCAKTSRNGKA